MNRLIIIVTGLHVLAHSIFGCCDQAFVAIPDSAGGHACSHCVVKFIEAGRHEHSHCDAVATHSDEFTHLFTTDISDQQSAPHQRHVCRHDSCHWLAGDASSDLDLLSSYFVVTCFPTISVEIASDATSGYWPESDIGRRPAAPLRLHLALGVLLI